MLLLLLVPTVNVWLLLGCWVTVTCLRWRCLTVASLRRISGLMLWGEAGLASVARLLAIIATLLWWRIRLRWIGLHRIRLQRLGLHLHRLVRIHSLHGRQH